MLVLSWLTCVGWAVGRHAQTGMNGTTVLAGRKLLLHFLLNSKLSFHWVLASKISSVYYPYRFSKIISNNNNFIVLG